MTPANTLLLIADISGYTRFLKLHRTSLVHAQDIVAQLLEAVIGAVTPAMKLAKIEGDAAFFHAPVPIDDTTLAAHAAAIFMAFHARRNDLKTNTLCPCDGCQQADALKIKLVGHVGLVAQQKIARRVELAGVDVVLVHRLLKNSVPTPEYLLVTDSLLPHLAPTERARATALPIEIEELGAVDTYYVDLALLHADAPRVPIRQPFLSRLARHVSLTWRSMPYVVGTKKACFGFRNVADAAGTLAGTKGEP
jgi:hypothetical protein